MLELRVFVDSKAPSVLQDAVTFETGATRAEVSDPKLWTYEHHGEGFGQTDPGALTSFFEDLILGRPLPLKFVTHGVKDVDTLVAMAAFTFRDVVLHPRMASFVSKVDLVHRRGFPILAHIEPDEVRFLRLLRGFFPDGLSRREEGERLHTALGWIQDYVLRSQYPALGTLLPEVRILTRGTDGWVLGLTDGTLIEGWLELYRQGYLKGVLFGSRVEDKPTVLVARKSFYVAFDLDMAAQRLNELEVIAGASASWAVSGDWLWGPPEGTSILASHVVEILVRC
jgi:hypothetical protein